MRIVISIMIFMLLSSCQNMAVFVGDYDNKSKVKSQEQKKPAESKGSIGIKIERVK